MSQHLWIIVRDKDAKDSAAPLGKQNNNSTEVAQTMLSDALHLSFGRTAQGVVSLAANTSTGTPSLPFRIKLMACGLRVGTLSGSLSVGLRPAVSLLP